MKYGIVTYSDRPMKKGNENRLNLGDPIQVYAMKYIYQQMGISEKDLIEISRYHAKDYNGEYVVLPFNCFNMVWNQFGLPYNTLPLSDKIIPVFLSFHLHSRVLSDEIVNNLRTYQPIGCRDEEILYNMRSHGIQAYMSGCVTALLPKRVNQPSMKKVFFVDIPKGLEKYIPEDLLNAGEFISHQPRFSHNNDDPIMSIREYKLFYRAGVLQLEKYRDEAALVVTSRLHAATPCMAMGIPVILVSNRFDTRFSFLDCFLPFYTPDRFKEIDWHPSPVEFEEQKKYILDMCINQIKQTYEKNKIIYSVSEFYEYRNREKYNKSFVEGIEKIKSLKGENVKYAIWGINSQSLQLINLIKDICPEWIYNIAIDKKVTGTFEGRKVITSDKILELDSGIIYFIVPEAAQQEASKLLKSLGKGFVLVKENEMEIKFENEVCEHNIT